MRKQTKIVAALSATALLALGASAMTFAAGWDNSTGTWQYLDNEGAPIADAWRKSGDYWFYLNSDGNMAVDQLIEDDSDYYYVNQDGAMVTNQWVALDSDDYDVDSDDGEAEYRWFYFGSDGKAYRNKSSNTNLSTSQIKTINGKKYTFDADGAMLYGWVEKDSLQMLTNIEEEISSVAGTTSYYFGGWNDGAAVNGWFQLSVQHPDDEDNDTDTYWFYADANGKVQKDKKKTINGQTYYFDQYGAMIDDWVDASEKTAVKEANVGTSASQVTYVNGDGSVRKNQWIWAVPAKEYIEKDYEDDEYSWWWANSNGKLFADGIKKIKGKTYAFDAEGRMLTDLVVFADDTKKTGAVSYDPTDYEGNNWAKGDLGEDGNIGAGEEKVYYFSSDEERDGSRKTGYQTVEFDDGNYQMYFKTGNGEAENGYVSKIKKFVSNGVVLKPDVDTSNYAAIDGTTSSKKVDGNIYYFGSDNVVGKTLINSSGTIVKSGKNTKDNNDVYYYTDKNGKIVYASTEKTYSAKTDSHSNKIEITIDGKTKTYYTENSTGEWDA